MAQKNVVLKIPKTAEKSMSLPLTAILPEKNCRELSIES